MKLLVRHLDPAGRAWAQQQVRTHHYLHAAVPAIARPEAWGIGLDREDAKPGQSWYVAERITWIGCLIVSRPQSARSLGWYGSLEDVAAGRCPLTRWQVASLSRVWIDPDYQIAPDGAPRRGQMALFDAGLLFEDRRGRVRSRLASTALRLLAEQVGFEYLLARPPVFPEEPYELTWLLSYCQASTDTQRRRAAFWMKPGAVVVHEGRPFHRGVIYRAAGWELHSTNATNMQTWRTRLPPLTEAQRAAILAASLRSERGRRYRGARERERAQLALGV